MSLHSKDSQTCQCCEEQVLLYDHCDACMNRYWRLNLENRRSARLARVQERRDQSDFRRKLLLEASLSFTQNHK